MMTMKSTTDAAGVEVDALPRAVSEVRSVPGQLRRYALAMRSTALLPERSLAEQARGLRTADRVLRLAEAVAAVISPREGR